MVSDAEISLWFNLCSLFRLLKKRSSVVVQHSQKQLTHQRFKDTLLSGKTLRIYNYSIYLRTSKAHTNITIAQNRLVLASFDSKSTEDNVFFQAIAEESEWANSQLTDSPTYSHDSGNSNGDNSGSEQSPAREFQVPGWGFLQESYTEEEVREKKHG